MPLLLLVAVALLLLLAWALAPRGIPWAAALVRVNPGSGRRAEWMAPPAVVRAVKRDFAAAQAWLVECSTDWGMLAGELDHYAAGLYLQRQRAALNLLVQSRGPRLAESLAAEHDLAVRHFSADGSRCLVIDRQTQRVMTSRRYWSGQPLHPQRLRDAVLVWQMLYVPADRRWKLERIIQALPARSSSPVRLSLTDPLPTPAGRDY